MQDFSCPTCNKTFGYEQNLRRHIISKGHQFPKTQTNEIRAGYTECPVCAKQVVILDWHMKIHHGSKQLTCGKCNKKFERKDALRRHESLVHHMHDINFSLAAKSLKIEVDTWMCKLCSKKFSSKESLDHHLTLKDCTEYICDYCEKIFKEKHNLTKHINNIHVKQEPFKCLKCEKVFRWKKSLKKHASVCK